MQKWALSTMRRCQQQHRHDLAVPVTFARLQVMRKLARHSSVARKRELDGAFYPQYAGDR